MKHIAIFRQPFLDMILRGEKTIESRWSINKIAPYKKVSIGDEILLKLTGNPIIATAKVKDVKYYELTPKLAEEIKLKYGKQIGIDKFDNWQATSQKKYCTLIWLEDIKIIDPIPAPKSNGSGWIILK